MFTITINGKVTNEKAKTEGKVTTSKTKTEITYPRVEGKVQLNPEIIQKDVKALGLDDAPLVSILVNYGTAKATGRLHNRCLTQFSRIGIESVEVPWEKEGGNIEYITTNKIGADAYYICHILAGIVTRAEKKISFTRHDLTMFDIQQAVGLIWGSQNGDVISIEVNDWVKGKLDTAKKAEFALLKEKQAKAKDVSKAMEGAAKAKKNSKKATGTKKEPEPETATLVVG